MTASPAQTGLPDAVIEILTGSSGSTVIVITLETAGFPVGHTTSEVTMHRTSSPLKGLYVNTGLFVPAFVPFTFHKYEGEEPPLTVVAEYVTDSPSQTGFVDAVILTLTGITGFTVIVTGLEVAGFPIGHNALEVSKQVITSPSSGL